MSKKPTSRAARWQRIRARQATLFSWIGAVMSGLVVLCLLVIAGILPSPFSQEFRKGADAYALSVPCPASGQTTIAFSQIRANVYNSTYRSGLANETAKALREAGVSVDNTDNWKVRFNEAARIYTGKRGLDAAYSLQAIIPGSVVAFSEDISDDTIDIVLGAAYEGLAPAAQLAQAKSGGKPVTKPAHCQSLD